MSGDALRARIDSVLARIEGTVLAEGELAGLLTECRAALTADAVPVGVGEEVVAFITHSATEVTKMRLTEAGMFLGVGQHPCYAHPPAALAAPDAEGREDSERLECLLMGFDDTGGRDKILECQLRAIQGDNPTLDEWRTAIDAARPQPEDRK